jgi:hypothetical protein
MLGHSSGFLPLRAAGEPNAASGPCPVVRSSAFLFHKSCRLLLILGLPAFLHGPAALGQALTFAGNAQHTGVYDVPAQPLNRIKWSTSIDLNNDARNSHYGAPLVTLSNTVIVPVRNSTRFNIEAFEGATGRLKYSQFADYRLPAHRWEPTFQPVIATTPEGDRLYYPGQGGTIFYISEPDSDTPGAPVHLCFYADVSTYNSNAAAFNSTVFINTPLTADTNGAVFFGFRMDTNGAPAPLSTTNGGFARIDSAGNSVFVLAADAAGDDQIGRDSHNSAPALSNDGTTLYVLVKSLTTTSYGYLLGLDSTTLATKYRTRLLPTGTDAAVISDDSTASPMVAPDGDVFVGVLGHGNLGFMLRYSADLSTRKTPGGFGWDYTGAIVPSNMLPSYTGSSPYLLFTKYNNYAGHPGDGINCVALLDPNAAQTDPIPAGHGLREMREIATVAGCTPDNQGLTYPFATREWCINTAAVNPATHSVFAPSEDGRIYRWDLAANCLSESLALGPGLGEPYVPTVIGPDGTVYTLNGGKLFALGGYTNMAVSVYSSNPNMCGLVANVPVTFTAVVTNLDPNATAPTGSVTFSDQTSIGLVKTNLVLAADVPLTNGVATVTTSNLLAGDNCFGNHFITAEYSGDNQFAPGAATMVQKVHARASAILLTSSASDAGAPVNISAHVSDVSPEPGIPTGMVSFWDGSNYLSQVALDTNGVASITVSNFTASGSEIYACYSSDTMFAASTARLEPIAPQISLMTNPTNSGIDLFFSNILGAPFTVLGTTEPDLASTNWTVLGPAVEVRPGYFQFSDPDSSNHVQRFYRVRSP